MIKTYKVTKNGVEIGKEITIDTNKAWTESVLVSLETILGRDLTDDELDSYTHDMYGNEKVVCGMDIYRFITYAGKGVNTTW